jgi:hypothetical protein
MQPMVFSVFWMGCEDDSMTFGSCSVCAQGVQFFRTPTAGTSELGHKASSVQLVPHHKFHFLMDFNLVISC